tara:strand:- start:875 stop:1594 length:720 start_codon:yes stop_codon:yes gene_type:complete
MDFKKEVERLVDTVEEIQSNEIDIAQPILPSLDFSKSKQNLYLQQLHTSIRSVQQAVENLTVPEDQQDVLSQLQNVVSSLETTEIEKLLSATSLLKNLTEQLKVVEESEIQIPSSLPEDIYSEIEADFNEMMKCFTSGCHRSVVILCGRMLEVVLHRKYYEVTENDLLEKSPGIGLGNLIAKMKEKGIELDPGLTQQIHLINQVRIHSVHKKQQPFYPSRAQAQAMMLYTQDVMQKVFD